MPTRHSPRAADSQGPLPPGARGARGSGSRGCSSSAEEARAPAQDHCRRRGRCALL